MHNKQKKIAAISDLTGFGRCALSVAMPIVSYMKVQCCPVPTSIFSNHTAYQEYSFFDCTGQLTDYMAKWKKLNLKFEGILSGFLGSAAQIDMVIHFVTHFRTGRTKVIVDPIMGDHGKIYATYTEEMCDGIRRLVSLADIVTPNLTECCKLTDVSYKEKNWKKKELHAMAEMLHAMGPEKIVITGIPQGNFIANYIYEYGKTPRLFRTHKIGADRSGTGDIFASIIAADAVNGVAFERSVKKASNFIKRCVARSIEMDIPRTDGVCFEEVIHMLKIN
ncbi:MAG: pyridoxamine kinase [Lachnospiraceae bacterium]|nr:pyridoxamine kinase [Lachnospiraceae bacterium]